MNKPVEPRLLADSEPARARWQREYREGVAAERACRASPA